jgi:hypothetical protein
MPYYEPSIRRHYIADAQRKQTGLLDVTQGNSGGFNEEVRK